MDGLFNLSVQDTSGLVEAVQGVTVGQILALLLFLAGVIAFIRRVLPIFKKIGDFLDDWNGTPPRPGVPHRPGVVERLTILERNSEVTKRNSADAKELSAIAAHEVKPNSGKSLRDQVDNIAKSIGVEKDESRGT